MDNFYNNDDANRREMDMEQGPIIANVNQEYIEEWRGKNDPSTTDPAKKRVGAFDTVLDGTTRRHAASCAFKLFSELHGSMEGGHPTAFASISGAVVGANETAESFMRQMTYTGNLQNNQTEGAGAGEGKNTTLIRGATSLQRVVDSHLVGPGDLLRITLPPFDVPRRHTEYGKMTGELQRNPEYIPFIWKKATKETFTQFVINSAFNAEKFHETIIDKATDDPAIVKNSSTPKALAQNLSLMMLNPKTVQELLKSSDKRLPEYEEQVNISLAGLVLLIADAVHVLQDKGMMSRNTVETALKTYCKTSITLKEQQDSMSPVWAVLNILEFNMNVANPVDDLDKARKDLLVPSIGGLGAAYDASCEHVVARATGFGTEPGDNQVDAVICA